VDRPADNAAERGRGKSLNRDLRTWALAMARALFIVLQKFLDLGLMNRPGLVCRGDCFAMKNISPSILGVEKPIIPLIPNITWSNP
jgi:hypothetical protein